MTAILEPPTTTHRLPRRGVALSRLRPARGDRAELRLHRLFRPARGRLRLRRRPPAADPRGDRGTGARASGATWSCSPSRLRPFAASPSVRRRWSPRDRLADDLGIDRLWLKDDTRNPTLSFKDRVVAVAVARAVEFGFDTIACASTGNLAGATAAAAAAAGLRAFVFVPSDLEPAKIDHALATARRSSASTARTTTSTGSGSRSPTRRAGRSSTSTSGRSTPRAARRSRSRSRSSSAGGCRTSSSGRSPRVRCSRRSRRASTSWRRSGWSSPRRSGSSAASPRAARRSRRRSPSGGDDRPGPDSPTRSSARWRSARRPTAPTRSSWRGGPAARSRRSRMSTRRPRSGRSRRGRASSSRRPAA